MGGTRILLVRASVVGSIIATGLGLVPALPAAADPGDLTVFAPEVRAMTAPSTIVTGPDGNLWAGDGQAAVVTRVKPSGAVDSFALPHGTTTSASDLAVGPDDALWYTNPDRGVARIATDGTVTEPTQGRIGGATAVAAGPDGNLWFARRGSVGLPVVSPAGTTVASYQGEATQDLVDIVAGPDGAMWTASTTHSRIGRVTMNGQSTTTSTGLDRPTSLTVGPDGNIWFLSLSSEKIGRVDVSTGVITRFPMPPADQGFFDESNIVSVGDDLWLTTAFPSEVQRFDLDTETFTPFAVGGELDRLAVAAGPDAVPWFANASQGLVGRLDPDTGDVTEFVDRSSVSQPGGMATGPDGNVWFTSGNDVIGRVTPTGDFDAFADPLDQVRDPAAIVSGPDAALWFTSPSSDRIGRIDPADGTITTFSDDDVDHPTGITVGPDDAVWFTSRENDRIGRLDPGTGAITTFDDTGGGIDRPTGITTGPDEAIWFRSGTGASIGRLDPGTGSVQSFPLPVSYQGLDLIVGPDGNFWLTGASLDSGAAIMRVTPAGAVTTFTGNFGNPREIITGPDGGLWFTNSKYGLARMTTDGRFRFMTTSTPGEGAAGLTAGPDGNIWYARSDTTEIGVVEPGGWPDHAYTDVGHGAPGAEPFDWAWAYDIAPVQDITTIFNPPLPLEPGAVTSRRDAVWSLWMLNGHLRNRPDHPFSDVGHHNQYTDAIDWAADEGIITGYPDGTFRPRQPVTAQQLARMVGLMLDIPPVATPTPRATVSHARLVKTLYAAAGNAAWGDQPGPLPQPVWFED